MARLSPRNAASSYSSPPPRTAGPAPDAQSRDKIFCPEYSGKSQGSRQVCYELLSTTVIHYVHTSIVIYLVFCFTVSYCCLNFYQCDMLLRSIAFCAYATCMTSVCLSICLSLSVMLVDCDSVLQQKVEIGTCPDWTISWIPACSR